MKRVIALLLALMMLPIFMITSQAAGTVPTMSETEFKEVLTGLQTDPTAIDYGADLIRAYRNISTDQLNSLRTYFGGFNVSVVSGITSPNTAVLSDEEAQILAAGFIKLMTFPNEKDGDVSNNNIGNNDLNRAAHTFYTDITAGSVTAKPADILNKLTKDAPTDPNGYMTKNALGAFVINLQKNLRQQAAGNLSGFLTAFVTPGASAYVDAVVPYMKKAAADAFTTPAGAELGVAKTAMIGNGMLTVTAGAVDETSPFIQLLVDTINALKNDNAEVMAVVMNTIISGVMDAKVEVYTDPTGTSSPISIVEPNNQVATLNPGESVYLKVVSDTAAKMAEEVGLSFVPSLSPSLDADVVDTSDALLSCATVERDPSYSNMLKLTGVSAGSAILKLYRDTNGAFASNDPTVPRHNDKELFMELNLRVKSANSPSGGSGASIVRRVVAPGMRFELDDNGRIIVTLETETEGATIFYTTDGTTPNENSQKYKGPFEIEEGAVVKAYAMKDGFIDSYVSSDTFSSTTPILTGEHIAYVHGRDTGLFNPEDNVTRAEVAAIFSRLIAKKMVFKDNSVSKFEDVSDENWYASYVKYLSNTGIIQGYEDGTFRPDNAISRAEFATVASRFFEIEKGESSFSDVPADHWAKVYIDSAATKGWLLGYEDGTFKPDQSIKRSEAVTIVNRMLNRVADKRYIEANMDKVLTYPDLDKSYWAYYEILEASNWHDHKIENNREYWTDIFYLERFNAS